MPRRLEMDRKIEKLQAFAKREGRAPSFSEMARLFGYASKNAVYRPVRWLVEHGYLQRGHGGRLALTSKLAGRVAVLGTVQAGFPSPAEEDAAEMISLDDFLVERPDSTYLLTVSGDSMLDAGIHPGDLVLVDKGARAASGDIVIAQVDGAWTMKYFGRDRRGVFLDPANARYQRIRPDQSLVIGGIVRAVVRKYR